jgi:hypothetical protein
MEKVSIQFNTKETQEGLAAFIRERAIKAGSHIVYMENDQIIEEDPRTGNKVVVKSKSSKTD